MKIGRIIRNKIYSIKIYGLLIIYILFVVFLMFYTINIMKKDYFNSIGTRALGIAIVTADHIKISDSEVERLQKLDFNSLLKDPANAGFEADARRYMGPCGVKYIYLMRKLQPDQVKYKVENGEEDYYMLPEGTPLDTVYLLDAVVSNSVRLQDTDNKWYEDKDRYTFLTGDIEKIYKNRETTYAFYCDEWGDYISGFAPVYSIEGNYVGILSVDIYLNEYNRIIGKRIAMVSVFSIMAALAAYFFFKSIRKIHRMQEKANFFREMAYMDYITGFFNRRMLDEKINEYWENAIENKMPLTVMMLDIDYFKNYNDQYGHDKGDEVLLKIASAIKLCTRKNLDLHFRYGGDEFLVLFFDIKADEVRLIAERIMETAGEISVNGINEKITFSIGIAGTVPNRNSDLRQLIRQADHALYISKHQGRNRINIYDETSS